MRNNKETFGQLISNHYAKLLQLPVKYFSPLPLPSVSITVPTALNISAYLSDNFGSDKALVWAFVAHTISQ